ncbi:NAD(P)-binding protein [Mycena galericulata]|nr:NAD(P)-binding protein [Mycena galericulata]
MGNFHSSKKFDPYNDIVDLSGRVVIVTGGNVGIGYSTVKFLARRGAKVYLAARNESKAKDAIAKLEYEGLGSGEVVFLKLDLVDPRMAKEAAQEFLSREKRLDVLINNAGMCARLLYMHLPPMEHCFRLTDLQRKSRKTAEGISTIMATKSVEHSFAHSQPILNISYIGPYVFTRTLLDLLIKTAQEPDSDVRIVNLSSQMHRMASPATDFSDPSIFRDDCQNGYMVPSLARYGVSKYATNLWTAELQRRLDDRGADIVCMSVHPGSVNTFAHYFPLPRLFEWLFSLFMSGRDDGAATSLFAAASPIVRQDPEKYRGQYMLPVGTLTSSAATRDTKMAEKLWTNTESFLQNL